MKICSVVLLGCLLSAPLWAQPAPAPAAGAAGKTQIAVINVRAAILSTEEGKAGIATMETRFGPMRQRLLTEQKQIQGMQQQLQSGADTLSADAKATLQDKIARRERNLREDTDNAQNDFEQAGNALVGKVMQKMMPIIKDYAVSHGYTVVLDSSAGQQSNPLLYAQSSVNIGPAIVKLYDQKYPAKVPATATPAPAPAPNQ